ncbi:MAG: (Fe-S)-binding protein [Bdellovibrionota bacterium]
MEHSIGFVMDWRLFYVVGLALVCGSIAFRSFRHIWLTINVGRAENLSGDIAKRVGVVLKNAVFQKKMFKDLGPGIFHMCIVTGFVVVTIGAAEHIIDSILRGFSFRMFLGPLYSPIILAQDVAQWLVVVAVAYFATRRLITKPKRLSKVPKHQRDGLIILAFTAGHVISDILTYAFLTRANDPHGQAVWRPLSQGLAHFLTAVDPSTAHTLGWVFWAISIGSVFCFLMYIPHSKHLHIVAAGPNIFLARLEPRGYLSQINFADETQTTFGVSKLSEWSWKDILDAYTCTACGRCNEFCPTAITGKPLQPMKLIQDLKVYAQNTGDAFRKDPTGANVGPMISDETGISYDAVWACTTCAACVEACPVMIEHVDKIVDMRRSLVLMEGRMPQELQNTFTNWERQSNPWGMPSDSRDAWAQELKVPRLAEKPDAEYLFYVGCAGSFNDRNKKISTAFVKILQKAGIDFAILGKEELCNGETARRAGNEYLAKTMIDANIETLKKYTVKKILTTCPHCFNTLKNEYPEFGFRAESVQHHTDFINTLMKTGKLQVQAKKDTVKIAFHDSCYLGRYNNVYEEPREALRAIGNVEVIEMPRNRKKGLCCGAGGARMWMEETIGKRINVERVEEALATQPDIIAAGCPFCQVMVEDGVKEKHSTVLVRDVAEIVAEQI